MDVFLGSIRPRRSSCTPSRGADGRHLTLAAKSVAAGDPAEFQVVNVEGTCTVLEAAERPGVLALRASVVASVRARGSASRASAARAASRGCRGDYAENQRRNPNCSPSPATRPRCASSRCARTSCGGRETRNWWGASSIALGADALPLFDGGRGISSRFRNLLTVDNGCHPGIGRRPLVCVPEEATDPAASCLVSSDRQADQRSRAAARRWLLAGFCIAA